MKDEISRLRRTIRDLRVEKIKSSNEATASLPQYGSLQFDIPKKSNAAQQDNMETESLVEQKGQTSRYIEKMEEPHQLIEESYHNHSQIKNFEPSSSNGYKSKSRVSEIESSWKYESPIRNYQTGKIVKNSPEKDTSIYSESFDKKPVKTIFNVKKRASEKLS